jgi:heme exporter protein D
MLGIDDPLVWLAYVGCIAMAAVCVIYGVVRRNAAADVVTQEDRAWAIAEKRVEDEI